jgi:hypothetical protein
MGKRETKKETKLRTDLEKKHKIYDDSKDHVEKPAEQEN